MIKDNYAEVAKKLDIKHRIGKYGIEFGSPTPLPGMPRKWWKVIRTTPLDGWIFDSKEITEALADDDDFKISYKEQPHER